ncbi:MAG: histidine kinase [Coriobacteriia bacterium]|nr:histidine kinase [Coriobacteriia bacterium]
MEISRADASSQDVIPKSRSAHLVAALVLGISLILTGILIAVLQYLATCNIASEGVSASLSLHADVIDEGLGIALDDLQASLDESVEHAFLEGGDSSQLDVDALSSWPICESERVLGVALYEGAFPIASSSEGLAPVLLRDGADLTLARSATGRMCIALRAHSKAGGLACYLLINAGKLLASSTPSALQDKADIMLVFEDEGMGYHFDPIDDMGDVQDHPGTWLTLEQHPLDDEAVILPRSESKNQRLTITANASTDAYGSVIAEQTAKLVFAIALMFVGIGVIAHGLFRKRADLRRAAEVAQVRYREEQVRRELAEARLLLGAKQMQPHLLCNALSAITEVILSDPVRGADLIREFTVFLRGCIRSLETNATVPFEKELEYIRAYVSIEVLRFGDRIKVEYDTSSTDFPLPPLSIQPLVENAIKHGLKATGQDDIRVIVRSFETKEGHTIEVFDNGCGFDLAQFEVEAASGKRESSGLHNAAYRLSAELGASVDIDSAPGRGTQITVFIPHVGGALPHR